MAFPIQMGLCKKHICPYELGPSGVMMGEGASPTATCPPSNPAGGGALFAAMHMTCGQPMQIMCVGVSDDL